MPISRTIDGSRPRNPRLDALRAYLYGFPLRLAVSRPIARNRPVYLCSYPKTGRTWLRYLLAAYMDDVLGLGRGINLTNMFGVIPNLSLHQQRGIAGFRLRGDERAPLLLATHAAYDSTTFARSADVLLLLRGVHDVVVSSFFHATRQRREAERFRGSLSSFIDDPYKGLPRFVHYHNAWAEQVGRRHAHVATYESLHAEPLAALRAILEFLELPIDEDALERAREHASFDAMQSEELERGIGGQHYDRSDPEALRVRKGRIGGYREYLAEGDIARISAECRRQLTPRALDMFARYGLDI
jgi:alcohol sulfotransferase